MRSLFLSAVLSLASLGLLLTTDSPAQAKPRHGGGSGRTYYSAPGGRYSGSAGAYYGRYYYPYSYTYGGRYGYAAYSAEPENGSSRAPREVPLEVTEHGS